MVINKDYSSSSYIVNIPSYEGPLDLLLQLIERAKLDITKLSLAIVTDQYLHYLKEIELLQVEEVSSFLIIAAKLLQIKSEALLPKPIIMDISEEDVGESLAKQLLEYKKYKEATKYLFDREMKGFRSYLRLSSLPGRQITYHFVGLDIQLISIYAQNILFQKHNELDIDEVITIPSITIREKIAYIIEAIKFKKIVKFSELIASNPNSIIVVITFIALLELIKQNFIIVTQEGLFGDLTIELSLNNEVEINLDLEFGE